MKKLVYSTVLLGATFGISSVAVASVQNFDGKTDANITVDGTLGANNKDPKGGITEGHDDWINVSLDTATIFYNKANQTSISSPNYSIENKSGRPVTISVGNFSHNDGSDPFDTIKSLRLNVQSSGDSSNHGGSDLLSATGVIKSPNNDNLITLANSKGQTNKTDPEIADAGNKNKATYTFSGETTEGLTSMTKPSFTLNLKFKAVGWNYDEPNPQPNTGDGTSVDGPNSQNPE